MRAAMIAAALLLPAHALAATIDGDGGAARVTICTGAGPVEMILDATGTPRRPAHRKPEGCAHLWCGADRRRPRAAAR